MEIRVETCDGVSMPENSHVSVRVGDVLKQGKYEPQRCYHFPPVERRRNARIDIYQHVGSCSVPVDPDSQSNLEASIQSFDPNMMKGKLKVNIQPGQSTDKRKEERAEKSNQLKSKAKEYLAVHSIEERLAEAVKALLKAQPADPTAFLTQHLQNSAETTPPKVVAKVEKVEAAPEAKSSPPVQQSTLPAPVAQAVPAPAPAAPAPAAAKVEETSYSTAPEAYDMPKDFPPYMADNVNLYGGNLVCMGMSPCPVFI